MNNGDREATIGTGAIGVKGEVEIVGVEAEIKDGIEKEVASTMEELEETARAVMDKSALR